LGFLSYLSTDGINVDTPGIDFVKSTLQSVNLRVVKQDQLSATIPKESSLISYLNAFENSSKDVDEHATSFEDKVIWVVTGYVIILGSYYVLKVDDQNVIHVHRLIQKGVPYSETRRRIVSL